MKKNLLVVFCLLSVMISPAQGIYQLWGTTSLGGADNSGTIFSTDYTGNSYQVRHMFKLPGAFLSETKLAEYNGKFYGMAFTGGVNDQGVIYEWDPVTNVYTEKFSFDGINGAGPGGNLTLSGGKFYGMTNLGGTSNLGVLFEWDPASNVYIKRVDFNGENGSKPGGDLTLSGGKLYGMTTYGGVIDQGVIFEFDPSTNAYLVKIGMNGFALGSLALYNGKLYGMTYFGGNVSRGLIFEWDPVSNVYTEKIYLDDINGTNPGGTLTLSNGKFYGTTLLGGTNNQGVIFVWDATTNLYTKKIDLTVANGTKSYGSLIENGGKFYGMTSGGGSAGGGVIFEWDTTTNVYTKDVDLTAANGNKPYGSFMFKGGKFYGVTVSGGVNNLGVIFEWDPASNTYIKKIDLNGSTKGGSMPYGGLTMSGGKFFGMTTDGGSSSVGVIFEYDRTTGVYTKKIDLNNTIGRSPVGNLSLVSGKFYGMTVSGGSNNLGVIFEWDPVSNIYTKKIDFDGANGANPGGSLTFLNGKFYGMTSSGGGVGYGVIFEWDPATNVYTKKIDFDGINGRDAQGDLVEVDGKFYGMTSSGGIYSGPRNPYAGVIFEWDPVTNIYTKKIDMNETTGSNPYGNLTLDGNKFYGQASSENSLIIFEWDRVTNVYTKKIAIAGTGNVGSASTFTLSSGRLFSPAKYGGGGNAGFILEWDTAAVANPYTIKKSFLGSDGSYPSGRLIPAPAPVAKGLPGSCVSFRSVTIDDTNNNKSVPVVDEQGDAVAEIKANGNNLGVVNISAYVNNDAVREDGMKRLYLDRNITITPTSQPTSAVDIRLYIKASEYQALKNAVNSNGEPSGISSINDLGIFKIENNCSPTLDAIGNPFATTTAAWENGYVLSASIPSFSSFYFANKALVVLPIMLTEFNGRLLNDNGLLNWKISNEQNTDHFEIERSIDGRNYTAAGTVNSVNTAGIHSYSFTDPKITRLGAGIIYYRLKQYDLNGRFTYSRIIALSINNGNIVLFYPNPVKDNANLTITINQAQQLKARVIDAAGKTMSQQQWQLSAGSSSLSVDVSRLAKGMYYLELKGATVNEHKQFSKQ